MNNKDTICEIIDFLGQTTDSRWIEQAKKELPTLLIDHAHCEKKAALSAIHLIHRYPAYEQLVYLASRLAREELRHFEKVIILLKQRNIHFSKLTPAPYATKLHQSLSPNEPQRLIDHLIIAALIEARSCERFYILAPHLDHQLQRFYQGLYEAEKRHFHIYLNLAKQYASEDIICERIQHFNKVEQQLINETNNHIRFHSGIPKTD